MKSSRKCAFCGECGFCGRDVGRIGVQHKRFCEDKNRIPGCQRPAKHRGTVVFLGQKQRWWMCEPHWADYVKDRAKRAARREWGKGEVMSVGVKCVKCNAFSGYVGTDFDAVDSAVVALGWQIKRGEVGGPKHLCPACCEPAEVILDDGNQ